tara:strand:- start:259 stop:591 length:333 start_codon:yes stop_codon:yes gene_type:complete
MRSKQKSLALRAISCDGWRWLRGMAEDDQRLPSLDDPATLGAIFQLVREAWSNPRLLVLEAELMLGSNRVEWRIRIDDIVGVFDSYEECLVASLEAADNRELLTPWENEQ